MENGLPKEPLQTRVIWFAHACFTGLLSCSRVVPCSSFVEPKSNTLSTLHKCNLHILVSITITVVAERRPLVEGRSVH